MFLQNLKITWDIIVFLDQIFAKKLNWISKEISAIFINIKWHCLSSIVLQIKLHLKSNFSNMRNKLYFTHDWDRKKFAWYSWWFKNIMLWLCFDKISIFKCLLMINDRCNITLDWKNRKYTYICEYKYKSQI